MQRNELAEDGTAGGATAQPDARTAEGASVDRDADPAEDAAVDEPTGPEPKSEVASTTTPATEAGPSAEADPVSEVQPEVSVAPDDKGDAGNGTAASPPRYKPSPRPRTTPAATSAPAASASGAEPVPDTGSASDAEPDSESTARTESAPQPTASTRPFKPSPRPRSSAAAETPSADQAPGAEPADSAEDPGSGAAPTPAVDEPAVAPEPKGGAPRAFKPTPRPRATTDTAAVEPDTATSSNEPSLSGSPTADAPPAGIASDTEPPHPGYSPEVSSPGWAHLAEDDHSDDADTRVAPAKDPEAGAKARKRWGRRIVVAAATIALMLFIPAFVVRMYGIPSGSMETTLHGCPGCDNDRVMVDRIVYRFRNPHPGEVVVFNAGPEIWGNSEEQDPGESNPLVKGLQKIGESVGIAAPTGPDFVKRVIAVGGQTVSCCDSRNRVVVDGVPVDEPYVYFSVDAGPAKQAPFAKIKVPDGMMWMMGDNRNASLDSRAPGNGPVPLSALAGKVRMIIYPLSRLGSVDDTDPQAPH